MLITVLLLGTSEPTRALPTILKSPLNTNGSTGRRIAVIELSQNPQRTSPDLTLDGAMPMMETLEILARKILGVGHAARVQNVIIDNV